MPSRPPNIVLTIADDQRGSALGCAGIEPVLTPHLDRLAARGTRFSRAQHLGSCHAAICAPSRAMLHTGHPYFRLDERTLAAPRSPNGPEDRREAAPPTLGQKLRQAGYHAFATGKWHNGAHTFEPSFDSAANLFFGGMADHWFTPVHDFDPSGRYPREAQHLADGFSTEVFARSAIDFIHSRRDNNQPFFCYCAFTAPHDPRTPPDRWRRPYNPSEMPLFPNTVGSECVQSDPLGVRPVFDCNAAIRDERLLGTPRDLMEIRRTLAEYYGMISHMDEWIGKIHQAVHEIGAAEHTIFVHTADHGLAVGQHGLLGKQNLFQHSLEVPLIVAGEGIPAGRVSEALCYQHDLHPSLLQWAGIPDPEPFFECLAPLMDGSSPGRGTVSSAYANGQRSIRDERYKLIEWNDQGVRGSLLYDLKEDPWETRNLIGLPSLEPVIGRLRGELRRWQKENGDPADWI